MHTYLFFHNHVLTYYDLTRKYTVKIKKNIYFLHVQFSGYARGTYVYGRD